MFLGLLLARAGVSVTVLEKHPDFLRDFRGDTVHPPTLRLLDDLGLGEEFRRIPAGRMARMRVRIGDRLVTLGDLARGPGRYRYFAMVPQWDLLDLLAAAAARERSFALRMSSEVTGLLRDEAGRVCGVAYRDAQGAGQVPAELVIGCDGRNSAVRRAAGLDLVEAELPMDVWWVRVPMRRDEAADEAGPGGRGAVPADVTGCFVDGHVAVSMTRHGFHQVAYLLAKGTDTARRRGDIAEFRARLQAMFGWDDEQVGAIGDWSDVKFLDARGGMLRRWWTPGVLCLGDAAHPMSPVMGVGINLAVQDAVAAARILAPRLRTGTLTDGDLARVERRRRPPTRIVRAMQDNEHDRLIRPALAGRIEGRPLPGFVRALQLSPRATGLATWVQASLLGTEPTPRWARR